MKDTIIVFARAPRLGTVKRRLAHEVGDRNALRFHTTTLVRLLIGLRADRRFRTLLAVTPDHARFRLPVRVPRIEQGGGDLGRRMHRLFARFMRSRTAIIGCDIPDATAEDVRAGFRALGAARAVFGPAKDGGYWFIGLAPPHPARPFANVRWSTEHALADTRVNFRARHVAFLRTLQDVDTAADLRCIHTGKAGTRSLVPHVSRNRSR